MINLNQNSKLMVNELLSILKKEKTILLLGNTGTGKSFLAKCLCDELNVAPQNRTIICFHENIDYADLIHGVRAETGETGNIVYSDKKGTFCKAIDRAIDDPQNTHIIVLEDIQRNDIFNVLGETITVFRDRYYELNEIEKPSDENRKELSDKLYFILTGNPYEDNRYESVSKMMSVVFSQRLKTDISLIYSGIEKQCDAVKYFKQVNSLISNNLEYGFRNEANYSLGQGFFCPRNVNIMDKVMLYQVIPILYQYVNEGIIRHRVLNDIEMVRESCSKSFSKHCISPKSEFDGIIECEIGDLKNNIRQYFNNSQFPEIFLCLVSRIIKQNVLSDADIWGMLNDPQILYRSHGQYAGMLVADENIAGHIKKQSSRVNAYSSKTFISHRKKKWYFLSHVTRTDYNINPDDSRKINDDETQQEGLASILYRFVKVYYEKIYGYYEGYAKEQSDDEINAKEIARIIKRKKEKFLQKYKALAEEKKEKEAEATEKTNDPSVAATESLLNYILDETILFSDVGDTVSENIDGITVNVEFKGVYKIMEGNMMNEIINAMNTLEIRQAILQGPPGTSKTYSAKKIIEAMGQTEDLQSIRIKRYPDSKLELHENELKYTDETGSVVNIVDSVESDVVWDIVQFHPSYDYEDFIRGIKVSTDGKDIVYETVNKVFGNILRLADHYKSKTFVLIIDEINRANLSAVLGELIYGLEYRKAYVTTPYSIFNGKDYDSSIVVNDNVYVIGTMNTADKSIGRIDYAIRRRFLFFPLLPNGDELDKYFDKEKIDVPNLKQEAQCIFSSVGALFADKKILYDEYRKEDVQIGHTYFMADSKEKLGNRMRYQVLPILKEYERDGILSIPNTDMVDNEKDRLIYLIRHFEESNNPQISDILKNGENVVDFLVKGIEQDDSRNTRMEN